MACAGGVIAGPDQVLVSMSGKRCKGTLAGYTASKFALMGLCQAMRNEGWGREFASLPSVWLGQYRYGISGSVHGS